MPDGPGCFPQGSSCPAVLRIPLGALGLSPTGLSPSPARRSSQVRLALRLPVRAVLQPRALPKGWRGLGCSGFARRYFRNRDCFLLLRVLRWFTSPGSPRRPMDSDGDDGCSHPSGSPIRTSPDHSLLAAPRGLSQLATSFFACLRLGIHTHALSSLAAKSSAHESGAMTHRGRHRYSVVKELAGRNWRRESGNPLIFAGPPQLS